MQKITKAITVTAVVMFAALTCGQDSPSLGDVARQVRQQKQDKEAKSKAAPDSKTPRIITEQQMPEHPELASKASGSTDEHGGAAAGPSSNGSKLSAEQWRSEIQAQESRVRTEEQELKNLKDSIQFAPGNCVYGCAQWNERQKEKQERAERMEAQLEEEKKRLEEMQESARQQGYGSSVYEP